MPEQTGTTDQADILVRAFLANMAQRAKSGGRLSDSEWERLERLAGLLDDSRQRPYAQLAESIRQLREKGEPVPKHMVKAAREAFLDQQGQHVFRSTADAAKEIGKTPQTIRNWADQGAPIVKRGAFAKAPVYRWLWLRAQERLADAQSRNAGSSIDEQLKQARLDERTGRLVDEAEDLARAACEGLMAEIQHLLMDVHPGAVMDAIAGLDRHTGEIRIRDLIRQELASLRFRDHRDHEPEETA